MNNTKWCSSTIKPGQHKMVSQHTIIHIFPNVLTYLPCIAQNGALRPLNLENIKWCQSTPLLIFPLMY